MVSELGQCREMLVHVRNNTKQATQDLKNCAWQMSELRSGATDQSGAVTTQAGSMLYLVSEVKTSWQAVLEALGKSVTAIQDSIEKGVHPERTHKRKLEIAHEEEEKEKRERSMLFPVIHPYTEERMYLNQEQKNQFFLDLQKVGPEEFGKGGAVGTGTATGSEPSIGGKGGYCMWSPVKVTLRLRTFQWEYSHLVFHLWHQQLYQCLVIMDLLLGSDLLCPLRFAFDPIPVEKGVLCGITESRLGV